MVQSLKSFKTFGNFTVCEDCIKDKFAVAEFENDPFECEFCERLFVLFDGISPEKKLDSAGWDIKASEDLTIPIGKVGIVKTGIRMAMPKGWEAQIRARSGHASRGIIVANGPGTIDHNYREEVGVILLNLSGSVFEAKAGDRVAQMLFARVPDVVWVKGVLDTTERKGGFGSTGVQ